MKTRRLFIGSGYIFIVTNFILQFTVLGFSYDVPTGIPIPASYFDGFDPINTPSPVVNQDGTCQRCPNWPSGESEGCYYIDKTDPNATDSNNPFGYPQKPRLTPPEGQLKAGDFVYFNAGTYTSSDSRGDRFDWAGKGTASNPIWICGNPINKPVIKDFVHIGVNHPVDYLILDNLQIEGPKGINIRPTSNNLSIDHVVIRHCRLTGTQDDSDSSGIGVGPTGGDLVNVSIRHTVIYNNHISNYGNKKMTEQCGVYLGFHTDYTWVLNNVIHDVGADGVAGCHRANDTNQLARHYFIGGNTIYKNGENSIDLKAIQDYVISQNNLYGPYSRENGWAIVLHYGQYSIGCKRGWIIFNNIHDAAGGVIMTDVGDETYVIGNNIYNIYDNPSTSDPLDGVAIGFRGLDGKLVVVNNSCYGYETAGMRCNQENLDTSDKVIIENNIFMSRTKSDAYDIRIDGGEDRISIRNNQYHYPGGESSIFWKDGRRNLSYMKSIGQCEGGQEGNPRLVNPPVSFSLQSTSPCIDKGTESQAYAHFQSVYGIDIRKDIAGTPRPQGNGWDFGAMEYTRGNGSSSPPTAPGNLRIQ